MGRAAVLLLVCFAACGKPDEGPDAGGLLPDAGGPPADAGSPPLDGGVDDAGTDAGVPCPMLWPVDATSARFTLRIPLFTYQHVCPTDAGSVIDSTFNLDLVDGGLTWDVCTSGPTLHQGRMELNSAQRDQIDGVMRSLVCSPNPLFGADIPTRVIELAVDGGTLRYQEVGNRGPSGTIYIRAPGVQQVLEALEDLAGIP